MSLYLWNIENLNPPISRQVTSGIPLSRLIASAPLSTGDFCCSMVLISAYVILIESCKILATEDTTQGAERMQWECLHDVGRTI